MNARTLATAMAILVAAGCSTSPDAQRQALTTATICCRQWDELPLSASPAAGYVFAIAADSPVYEFPTGRSHFVAFPTPDRVKGHAIRLRTFVGSPTLVSGVGAHSYFLPFVTFLDSSRKPIATVGDQKPRGEPHGFAKRGSFVSSVSVPKDAAYTVIHTVPVHFGELYVDYVHSPGFTTMVRGAVLSSGEGLAPIRAVWSSTGEVMVE